MPPSTGSIGLARFHIGTELGRGGMGVVVEAQDRSMRRTVAVKRLLDARSPLAVEQFVEEAQITGQLEHPNIVPVHELGADDEGRPWLAMKRVAGQNLAEWIKARAGKPLQPGDVAQLLDVFGKVCDAIRFAHHRGVRHRDLKPHTVRLGSFGEVMVMEWGLAKPLAAPASHSVRPPDDESIRVDRREQSDSHTVQGHVMGSPAWMPPEQALGETDAIDERSDVFALGALLYHMLVGQPPYAGRNVHDVLRQAALCEFVAPRTRAPKRAIPRELEGIVLAAMAPQREDRYATVGELQDDLDAYRSFRRGSAWRDGLLVRVGKWARRNPTRAAVAVLGTLFVAVAGLIAAFAVNAVQAANLVASEQARGRAEAEARAATDRETAAREREAAREAHMRELIQAQQYSELKRLFDLDFAVKREAIIEDFISEYRAMPPSTQTDVFVRGLGRERAMRLVSAYRKMIDASEATGEDYLTTADWMLYGLMLRYHGDRPDEAVAAWDRALELDPQREVARFGRAGVALEQNRLDDALRDADYLIAHKPAMAHGWSIRGNIRVRRKDWNGALDDCNEALRRDADHRPALMTRSQAFGALGRFDEALADLDRAIALDPSDPLGWFNRSTMHTARRDFARAVADLDEALTRDERPGWLSNRAAAKVALGQPEAAMADYNRALELDANDPHTWYNRGNLFGNRGDLPAALSDFTHAIQLQPAFAQALHNRAVVLKQMGRDRDALADLRSCVQADPTHWQAWYNIASLLLAATPADHPGALEAMQQAYRNCRDAATRNEIAGYIRQLGGEPR